MAQSRTLLPARSRTAPRSTWLLVAVLALGVALAPAVVASSVTAEEQPASFATEPWLGWTFLGEVVSGAGSAKAASPGDALRLAQARFDDSDGPRATAARLAYTPAGVYEGSGSSATITVDAASRTGVLPGVGIEVDEPLVWLIDGRQQVEPRTRGVIGIIGYESADTLFDVRDLDAEAALDAAADTNTPAGAADPTPAEFEQSPPPSTGDAVTTEGTTP